MPKGMFTQCACILLDRVPHLDEVQRILANFKGCKRIDSDKDGALGGPMLLIDFRPEVRGTVSVDIVAEPWPDSMGDPQSAPMVFAAWSMGLFGPFTFPGGLTRASQQSWAWAAGQTVAEKHHAFIRIRSSYAVGSHGDDPIMPKDYQPVPELEFINKVVTSLLKLPQALCYFNPNGEVLRDREGLVETIDHGTRHDLPPLDAWSNVRMFNINAEWSMMDTVGNGQLDIPDIEACFHSDSYDFNEVDNFLRNVSLYILRNGEVIKDGDTMDGPSDVRWKSHPFENGICDPPRRVLRWMPMDGRSVPIEVSSLGTSDSA
jgi:hypothetical protein